MTATADRRGRAASRSPSSTAYPLTAIGTTGGDELVVEGQFSLAVTTLRDAWSATLPAALG